MSILDIQKLINKYPYVDARAKKLECNYFSDEVTLVYENSDDVDICCKFSGCYKTVFDHNKFDKLGAVKNMNYGQMPYFMFDINITDILVEKEHFYICKIDMGLLEVEIWCKNIIVNRIKSISTDGKTCFEFTESIEGDSC